MKKGIKSGPFIVFLLALFLGGCDELVHLNPFAPPSDPHDFPQELSGVILTDPSTVTNSADSPLYPRFAVSLTNPHIERTLGISGQEEDCGHFKVTEWTSATDKKVLEFDTCIRQSDEIIAYGVYVPGYQYTLTQNSGYIFAMDENWNLLVQTGGNKSPDYQPMGPHWTEGPKVAQFFVPPSFIPDHKRNDTEVHLINAFLNYAGQGRQTTVNPRIWFYQVGSFN